MPVVSKGEFTVSRLDDGVSSHLHVGWLMADGTFTTEYPRENLFSTKDWQNRPSFSVSSIPAMKILVEPNTEYIMSTNIPNWADNNTCDLFVFNTGWVPSSTVNGVALNKPRKVTTLADGIIIVAMRNREFSSGTFWAKLEKGTTPTIYTPSPSEDYSLAYPKYRGEYTDTIEADSTDPDRYTWTAYLGEQGPPTGVISQNTVPSSPYVGMLWQNTGNVSGYISNATYRWNGSAWEIYQFTAQNIMADTFTGFTFQGVKMIASEFISHQEFDRVIQEAPESIIENHVTDISIADGRLLIETNVDTKHDLSAGVRWTDQVHMETTVDDTLGFIIDGTRRWGQDGTTTYSALVQNSEYIALLPNSRDTLSEKDMVTNDNWRNVVATKHCGRQLWEGGQYMTSSQVVTPMVKMSDCLNGWLLQWQRYNPGVGLDSSRYFYQPISKLHPSGKGITTYISAPASATDNGGVPAATKYIYVTDTTITGYDSNSVSPGNNWALSGVFGW